MDTSALKKFAPQARNLLIDQVEVKLAEVLAGDSAARREQPKAVAELEKQVGALGEEAVVEKVAYTWFNRLTALRYMDANGLNMLRVVTPAEGQSQPEILAEAMAGHIDTGIVSEEKAARVRALLNGAATSSNPQDEAYRLLTVAVCNSWHDTMPFMFERIEDYTELLMPTGLLAPDSVLARLREVMTDETCEDVEVIGWLYQFYISEKKDEVFAGLKKNKKITAENIPAATQLFTPHWIVRYLVENSLGRLWLLNRPQSRLAERMDYYIAPEEPETDFLRISKPEDIRICDPAVGSGHMLTYAFDLLFAIYEEEGYDANEIPALILTHNLTGVEIDDRAAALAAFALAMKAAQKLARRRFLRMEVKPNICVLHNVRFTQSEMQDVAAVVGEDLFTDELRETLSQFEQAKNFGSLIVPKLTDPAETLRIVEARDFGGDLLLREVQERVLTVLRMAEALSPKYHVVVANPPYMGSKGMNADLNALIRAQFKAGSADLYSAFMERVNSLGRSSSYLAVMTPFTWMSLKSFEGIRRKMLSEKTIISLVKPEYHSFFESAYVPICAFIYKNFPDPFFVATYFDLEEFVGASEQPRRLLEGIQEADRKFVYRKAAAAFLPIPSCPIAFWAGDHVLGLCANAEPIGPAAKKGLSSGDNEKFLRFWHEVARSQFSIFRGQRWYPTQKGGEFRRWYGNRLEVVDWENDGHRLKAFSFPDGRPKAIIRNEQFYFQPGATWTDVSIAKISFRYVPEGSIPNASGPTVYAPDPVLLIAGLNSKVTEAVANFMSPTFHFEVGQIQNYPALEGPMPVRRAAEALIDLSRVDWDSYETSWDFTALPLLAAELRAETLESTYDGLRANWQRMTNEMQRLEEENNRIFIEAYGLQDELNPEVPIEEITLTCNPAYRYGVKNDVETNDKRLRADTMAELLSYAVGCMFGRFSLDKPGLILANQGETLEDYLIRVPNPTFLPDADNVIPVLNGDWFPDDITERFRLFLRTTFGEDNFAANLRFIEDALGKDIRKYFLRDFYNDHMRRYKKRPIYWMFSSPKGSFNALIYMHRYQPDTVSVVLNDYLREYMRKLEAHLEQQQRIQVDPGASATAKAKATKELEETSKILAELESYEKNVLYPLATERKEIDLDDGVKANYPKLGSALKAVKGLSE